MIKCKKCKEKFMSLAAYGIHTYMRERVGRQTTCPTTERLQKSGMSLYGGQWVFLSDEMKAELNQ